MIVTPQMVVTSGNRHHSILITSAQNLQEHRLLLSSLIENSITIPLERENLTSLNPEFGLEESSFGAHRFVRLLLFFSYTCAWPGNPPRGSKPTLWRTAGFLRELFLQGKNWTSPSRWSSQNRWEDEGLKSRPHAIARLPFTAIDACWLMHFIGRLGTSWPRLATFVRRLAYHRVISLVGNVT